MSTKTKPSRRTPVVRELVRRRFWGLGGFSVVSRKKKEIEEARGPGADLWRTLTRPNQPKVLLNTLQTLVDHNRPAPTGHLLLRRLALCVQSCRSNLGDLVLAATSAVILAPDASPPWLRARRGRVIKVFTPAGFALVALHLRKNKVSDEFVVVFRLWS